MNDEHNPRPLGHREDGQPYEATDEDRRYEWSAEKREWVDVPAQTPPASQAESSEEGS